MPAKAIYKAHRVANSDLTGWLEEHAVVVENGRIASVLPQAGLGDTCDETYKLFDLGDVSLLPGLVDAHCHMHCSATEDAQELIVSEDTDRFLMRSTNAMRRALMAGTTTVRDLGARNEVAFPIKDAIEAGAIPGPRLICSGTPITLTAGHCWFFGTEADTTEEVLVALRRQAKLGAGVIKIWPPEACSPAHRTRGALSIRLRPSPRRSRNRNTSACPWQRTRCQPTGSETAPGRAYTI